MAQQVYVTHNAVTSALTAPMAGTATSATSGTVKTILQLKPGSNIRIKEWGYIITQTPSSPVQMELIDTSTVGATVTAGSISNYNIAPGPTSLATTGTSATGFNSTAEGTITATRLLGQTMDLSTFMKQQFPLGSEPSVESGNFLRIRATPTTNVASTILCYLIWEE